MDNNNNNTYYFNNLDDEYSYDLEVDALYIEKKDDDYVYSIEVTSKLIIDFNSTKDIIGVEMLDVSRILKIDEEELINPKTVNIEITTQNNETYLIDIEINGQHLIIYKNSNGVYYMNNNQEQLTRIEEKVLNIREKITDALQEMLKDPTIYSKETFEKYYLASMTLDSLECVGDPELVTLNFEEKKEQIKT